MRRKFPTTEPECGQALARWRQQRGWTQEEMSKQASVPLRILQKWEACRTTPRPGAMKKIEAVASGHGQEDRFARIEARLEKIETLLERMLKT